MSWKDSIRKQDKRKVTEETFRDWKEREEAREFLQEDLENVLAELETLDIDNMNADDMKELSKALGKVSVLLQ